MFIRTENAEKSLNLSLSFFRGEFPWAVREEATAERILSDSANAVFLAYDGEAPIGVAVLKRNTILLLAVKAAERGKGCGTALLSACERAARAVGYSEIRIGVGDEGGDYLTPGVPTSTAPYSKETVPADVCPPIDASAVRFLKKRGYFHSWGDCDCFDMRASFRPGDGVSEPVGITVDGVSYRWADASHMEGIRRVTDAAEEGFTGYYQNPALYEPDSPVKVITAASDGVIVGVIMASVGTEAPNLGSVGCVAVHPAYQHRGIASRLVRMGAGCLIGAGLSRGFLGYTYSGLENLYGRAGFRICTYYFMAKKNL